VKSDPGWSVVALRYFNPVGANESGLISESPGGIPNNLMPYVCVVATGKLPYLHIFGNDCETKDGTGERYFIHVMDLAEGHAAALKLPNLQNGFEAINLVTGVSHSILDLIRSFEEESDQKISVVIQARRIGDLPIYYSQADKARKLLG